MPEADPIADLAVRERQLRAHLLGSSEYQRRVQLQIGLWIVVLAGSLILTLGEGILDASESGPAPALVMGSIGVTSLVFILSVVLLFRSRGCRHQLNERLLDPEAKKVLQALRRERARAQAGGAPAAPGS